MFSKTAIDSCHTAEITLPFLKLIEETAERLNKPDSFTARPHASPFPDNSSELPEVEHLSDERVKVYGTHTKLGNPEEPNHSLIVAHDTSANKCYVLFSGQALSNFNGPVSGNKFAPLEVSNEEGAIVATMPNTCNEHGFQAVKAIVNANMEVLKAVLEAKKPGAAKVATSFKNLPNCVEEWHRISKRVMTALMFRKYADAAMFQDLIKLLKFCLSLGVDINKVYILENTDDKVWGNGMKPEDGGLYSEAAVAFIKASSTDFRVRAA